MSSAPKNPPLILPPNSDRLADRIRTACSACGALCCRDFYDQLVNSRFAATKKELILFPDYRDVLITRLKAQAEDDQPIIAASASALARALEQVDYTLPLPAVLEQLSALDRYYTSCEACQRCLFLKNGQCLIQESKEFLCGGYYCAASSYQGRTPDLRSLVNRDFRPEDIYRLHLQDIALADFWSRWELELSLFRTLDRASASFYLRPQLLGGATSGLKQELTKRMAAIEHDRPELELQRIQGRMSELNERFFHYYRPELLPRSLCFIYEWEEADLAELPELLTFSMFPTLVLVPEWTARGLIPLTEKHYPPARFGLYHVIF